MTPRQALRLAALVVLVAGTPLVHPAAAEASGAPPAVIAGRLLDRDPAAPPGEDWYLVEVAEVRHGEVAGSVLSVRLPRSDAPGRGLAARALAAGSLLELTVVEGEDGRWRATAVRAAGTAPSPTRPRRPLAVSPRSRVAAVAAEAPFEHRVVELVNEERLAEGNLPPLKVHGALVTAAHGHSAAMAQRDFFSHCDLDTLDQPGNRVFGAGYVWNAVGENIAAGSSTPEAVMALWMASPGHRANILSTGFHDLGVGYFAQPDDLADVRMDLNSDCDDESTGGPFVHYWTQDFGFRQGSYPLVIDREAWNTSCAAVDLYAYGIGFATEMRFSNDGSTWSDWEPYTPDTSWMLDAAASDDATVHVQVRDGNGVVRQASDDILLTDDYPAPPSLDLSAQTVTGSESWVACGEITAGDGFEVAASGDAAFQAPSIVLAGGFAVAVGGTFRAGS